MATFVLYDYPHYLLAGYTSRSLGMTCLLSGGFEEEIRVLCDLQGVQG